MHQTRWPVVEVAAGEQEVGAEVELGGGILEWTSPIGTTYTDYPPTPGVHFAPDPYDPSAPPPPDAAPADACHATGASDAPF